MAVTPRPVSISLPASAPNARPSSVSRALSGATDGSAVEETSAQASVSFDTAMMFHHDEQAGDQRDDKPNGQNLVEFTGGNQTFVSILEESGKTSGGQAPDGVVRRGFSGYLSRAISVYETTAQVIHGSGPDPRGSTLSLTL